MTERNARELMNDFFEKYANRRIVFFSCIDGEDKLGYILIDSFRYFQKFLPAEPALQRAISNALAHKKNGFKDFDISGASHIKVRGTF